MIYLTVFKRFMCETKIGQHYLFLCVGKKKTADNVLVALCLTFWLLVIILYMNFNNFKASLYIKGKYSSRI